MMYAKFSDFLTPPPFLHLDLIYTTIFMQPPLLHLLFHDPPPPLMQTSYLEAPRWVGPSGTDDDDDIVVI